MNIEALDEHVVLNPEWPHDWCKLPEEMLITYVDVDSNLCDTGRIRAQAIMRKHLPAQAHYAPMNSVLLTWSASDFLNGGIGIIQACELCHPDYAACSTKIAVLAVTSGDCDKTYLMHWLRHYGRRSLRDYFLERGKSKAGRLPRSALPCYWLYLPNLAMQTLLVEYLEMKYLTAIANPIEIEIEMADQVFARAWQQIELALNWQVLQ